ncbi:EamA family transporter [Candidatus Peribacteria bacterium]|nr:EamA family transporter [Candidatus Peribacteria bacterium]
MHHEKTRAIAGLNVAVFVMSMAGLFAKLIDWNPVLIILGRATLTAPFIALYLVARRRSFALKRAKHVAMLFGLGAMMMCHWTSYFASIQTSTVAIGILSTFTSPIITTFLEPLFDGKHIRFHDVVIALIAFAGIVLMIDDFSLGGSTLIGVMLGMLSASFVSLRNIWSKGLMNEYGAPMVMFWQMLFGAIFLLPTLFFFDATVTVIDIRNLCILALFATAIAHTLMLNCIHHIGARATGVMMMVQPLYAILLAFLILGEVPALRVALGGILVLGAAGFESVKQAR